MFCSKCGKENVDNAKFCNSCGYNFEQVPSSTLANEGAVTNATALMTISQTTSPASEKTKEMFGMILSTLKGFFSNNVMKSLGDSAKSNGLEWIIFFVISVFSFAFALTINIFQAIDDITKGLDVSEFVKFGPIFGANLLISIVTLLPIAFGIWTLVNFIYKKPVRIFSVFNMVGYATIPITIVYVANMLFGLIHVGIALVLSITAIVMSCVILYIGIQKLAKLEKTPFFAFATIMLITIVLILLIGGGMYKNILEEIGMKLVYGLSNSLSSLF